MLHYVRVQREDQEVVQITCNKCGKVYPKSASHPDFTEIKNTYGYGSKKDGDKYVSHICEPCMDEFYASFKLPPQVAGMVEWGEEPRDPVLYLDAIPAEPVAPAGEDHASQEKTSEEPASGLPAVQTTQG